jgi:hypothetical protein
VIAASRYDLGGSLKGRTALNPHAITGCFVYPHNRGASRAAIVKHTRKSFCPVSYLDPHVAFAGVHASKLLLGLYPGLQTHRCTHTHSTDVRFHDCIHGYGRHSRRHRC